MVQKYYIFLSNGYRVILNNNFQFKLEKLAAFNDGIAEYLLSATSVGGKILAYKSEDI